MASRFDGLMHAMVEPSVDRLYGERVRIEPMLTGQYRAGEPDPDRPVREVTAIVTERSETGPLDGEVPGDKRFRGKLAQRPMRVSFDRAVFAARSGWPRQGDRVIRLDEEGAVPLVAEGDAYPNGATRVDVDLVAE